MYGNENQDLYNYGFCLVWWLSESEFSEEDLMEKVRKREKVITSHKQTAFYE